MQHKTKNKIITIGFAIILIGIFLCNLILKDKEISITERRKLAQLPKINIQEVLNGNFTEKWDKYTVDQFVGRDFFKTIKAVWSMKIYSQKDNNDLFIKDNAIYKMEYPLNEKNIEKNIDKIKNVYDKNLKDMNVYYAIIPDKNYYLEDEDYLKIDYNELQQIAEDKLTDLEYINIWDDLKLEDYYKTDLHWKQENLQNVVKQLQDSMNLKNTNDIIYTAKDMGEFYGSYYNQLGLNLPVDKLKILTNDTLENCITYNYEKQKTGKIYETPTTADKYDIFLSGATPLISIENPNSKVNKELILFRDSFGSSIAPLLVENYSKITLVDLRYISSDLLNNHINFEKQDVLFLYSVSILNQNTFKN